VLTAILYDFKNLQAKEQTDATRLVALKSLGHWVGDIHQPLHVSFFDDRGGNTIRKSGQCPEYLHAVWDTCLVQYAVGPDASEAATDLLAVTTPEMKAEWMLPYRANGLTKPLRSLRPPGRSIASTAERPATQRQETWRLARNISTPMSPSSRSSFRKPVFVWPLDMALLN
jgi:S1/P1 Nuclease